MVKNYSRHLLSIFISLISYFIADILIIQLSKSPNGTNTDFGYVEIGIKLIIAIIVGCTSLIIFTIKSKVVDNNSNSNQTKI